MKTKKILAVLLSFALILSFATQLVCAEDLMSEQQDVPGYTEEISPEGEGTVSIENESLNGIESGISTEIDDDFSPALMSLLPLEYHSEYITIDRTKSMPIELVDKPDDSIYVYEALKDALVKNGLMTENEEEPQDSILLSTDDDHYSLVGWNDIIPNASSKYLYFIIGDGDQLNPENIKFMINVYITKYISKNVTIDRTESFPEELVDEPAGTVYISELINDVLLENGLITAENLKYNGTIKQRISSKYDPNLGAYQYTWNEVTQEDKIVVAPSEYWTDIYFCIDDGLGADTSVKYLEISYKLVDTGIDLMSSIKTTISCNADENITASSNELYDGFARMPDSDRIRAYRLSQTVSSTGFEEDEAPKLHVELPEKYAANTAIYLDLFNSESGIDESKNITAALTGEEPYQLSEISDDEIYNYSWHIDDDAYIVNVTFVVDVDGRTVFVPAMLSVDVCDNYVSIDEIRGSSDSQYPAFSSKNPQSENDYIGSCYVVTAPDFDHIVMPLRGYYYDYINTNNSGYNSDSVTSAYFGSFESEEAAIAAGAENIRDSLFDFDYGYGVDYTKGESQTAYIKKTNYPITYEPEMIEIQFKTIVFTVFDEYGLVHHPTFNVGLIVCEIEDIPQRLSDDTYFRIDGAMIDNDNNEKNTLDYYIIDSSDDTYYRNGYQTVLVTDKNNTSIADGTTIYPTFTTGDKNIKVFNGLDASGETSTNRQQISGQSPAPFINGEAIQYSAASQSGTHLKNYWVTYLTPYQGGSKLFVNATNNPDHYDEELNIPVREIFFNPSYGYSHDILFANIGNQDLTGISVKLENGQGVGLDQYWTINENSVKKLAPFTTVDSPYYKYDEDNNYIRLDGELYNIAKVRLNSVDDNFGAISGTLTISADGSEPVVIKLTGIAGTPKIVSDKVYDGVKYVPYSSVIMTNSMYEDDAMEFSIVEGKLPNGISLLPNGELYGIPTETGDFTFTVQARYTGTIAQNSGDDYTDSRTYTMHIKENTDENVDAVNMDEQGYELTDRISRYVTVYYSGVNGAYPVIDRIEIDSDLFRSEGSYTGEFKAFYIDSIKLTEGVDYTAEEGSTKITVLAQTFGHIMLTDSTVAHTLAAEFRNDINELRRSAQNVYLNYIKQTSGGTSTPSYPGSWQPNTPLFESVTAVMSIVSPDGMPCSDLSLELHSTVQYATTDSDGSVQFDNVDFGRHTLYAMDLSTGKKVSKSFTITAGFDTRLTGDIIVAEVGQVLNIAIQYDGSRLTLLSTGTETEIDEEVTINAEDLDYEEISESNDDGAIIPVDDTSSTETGEVNSSDEQNPATGIALCIITPIFALIAFVVCKMK